MTQEDKQLLLTNLCARLPYGVVGLYTWKCKKSYNRELSGNLYDELCSSWSSTEDSQFLPYLRPMSSMTEEEEREFQKIIETLKWTEEMDFYNKYHFDYRGLIERGLAIRVTEKNNPYKN